MNLTLFRITLISTIILMINGRGFGQDTLILLNGEIFVAHVSGEDEYDIEFESYYTNKGKLKEKEGVIDKMRVYSIIDKAGEQRIIYKQDTLLGNDLSKEEMYSYILGERHATQHYTNSRWWFVGGLLSGYGLTVYDTYLTEDRIDNKGEVIEKGFFHSEPSFTPVIYVFAYTLTPGLLKVNLNSSKVDDKALLLDEAFLSGYERKAKKKRLFSSLAGSLAGVTLGFVTYGIFKGR